MLLCAQPFAQSAPPKAARSVHLWHQAPDAIAFYNEMTVDQSVPGSYFMACGWNTGYFGIQELANGSKVVLFSVWDPTKGDDPDAILQEDRVECLHSDPSVRIRRFGGEGTGGQCMGDFPWEVGKPVDFAVKAIVQGTKTAYSGYIRSSDSEAWRHLVTFRTRTGGMPLRGLYSFVEDFRRDGKSAEEKRRATFGNTWIQTIEGEWLPVTQVRFTASNATWEAKETIHAGVVKDRFFLETGGDTRQTLSLRSMLKLGENAVFTRPQIDW